MAANLSVYGYVGLTQGAAHLIEAFGSDALRTTYMARMYRGEWTGTMALTEPQAGSSLADITTTATPAGDHHLLRGAKIFISAADHDLTDNIVHMTLARIAGAPAGMKVCRCSACPGGASRVTTSSTTTSRSPASSTRSAGASAEHAPRVRRAR